MKKKNKYTSRIKYIGHVVLSVYGKRIEIGTGDMENNGVGNPLEELFGSDSDEQQGNEEVADAYEAIEDGKRESSSPRDGGHGDVDMKDLFGSDDDEDGERGDDIPGRGEVDEKELAFNSIDGEEKKRIREPMEIPVNLYDGLAPKSLVLAKLPNSLRIEPSGFVPSDFKGDDDRVPTIRWRHALDSKTNELIRESNARIVTWSDGSRTLHVGNDSFQVKSIDVGGDHAFLYVRHPNLVQCQSKFMEKLLFNPIGVDKAVRPKVSVQQESRVKVKQTATLVDPLKEREEKERAEEARIKDKEKLQEKQKQHMRRSIMQSRVPPARNRHYLSAAFLEGDDDDDVDAIGYGELDHGIEEDEDDGFIVPDDDEEEGEEEGHVGEEYVDGAGDDDDMAFTGRTFERQKKRKEIDEDEEEKGAERLVEILTKNTDDGSGGPLKKRAVLIDSDSD